MELRDHPLMSYRGVRNWPPAWTRIRGSGDKQPNGEVGTLREIRWPPIVLGPADRFFLVIDHDAAVYMGCLLFSDAAFCRDVEQLLRAHCGCTLAYIGSLEIGYTL
jgi:hypothetical protein